MRRSTSPEAEREITIDTGSVSEEVASFIDGELDKSRDSRTIEAVNPSNGRPHFHLPAGCPADAVRAVESARTAFDDGRWSDMAPSFRNKTLHRLADLIAAEAEVLDRLDAADMGKPVAEVFGNATMAARLMRFYAEAVDKVSGETYGSDKHSFVAQRRMPRGVVAAVLPWNFPTVNAVSKIAPALASGNCVVVKPSELSPRSAIVIARLAIEAGLLPGILNVVLGLGETVGQALGLHRDVDMLTFTGSTVVGKRMLQYAGESNMKVVLAECGGKSPHIVFDDGIDLDVVSESIARSLLINQGQLCNVGSRLLVQHRIEATLIESIATKLQRIVMGDAMNPKTTFGPVVSSKQCARILQYIEGASREGAQLVLGGRRVLHDTGGFFVEPTIFRNVSPSARIAQEEIFGPVLSVMGFEEEEEALQIANGTVYGLNAYVWTSNLSRGMRMARGIRSSVRINAVAPVGEGAGFAASHEPIGQSGIGVEGGLAGLESYTRRQRVWVNHG